MSFSALDEPPPARKILWHTLKALVVIIVGFPVAVLGVAVWWVPYRLCGVIANRVPGASEQRDQIALYKLVSGVALFPVTLAVWTAVAWVHRRRRLGRSRSRLSSTRRNIFSSLLRIRLVA